MKQYVLDGWRIEHDAVATAQALEQADYGGPEECGCVPCQNFVALRSDAFPGEFLKVLDALGIKRGSEVEVYHNARLQSGQHSYGGWFHFIGQVVGDPGNLIEAGGGFQFFFRNDANLVSPAITRRPVGQVEFSCELPWTIEALEPI